MYTYLLKNKQGSFETTTLTFKTRKQAQHDAQIWAKNWLNLTGDYVIVQVKNFEKVNNTQQRANANNRKTITTHGELFNTQGKL